MKYQESDAEKGSAMEQLLSGGVKRRLDSSAIYMEDEEDLDGRGGGVGDGQSQPDGGVTLNGKMLLNLATITPNSPSANAYLFRNKFSSKINRRGVRKRVIFKNGDCNVTQENVAKRRRRYLADIFTTLVDIQWRYNLMVFSLGFLLSWLGFAIVWWLICFTHGDLERADDQDWRPCVHNLRSFTSAFLFSVETQHTIGYGSRYAGEECPEAVVVLCVQSIAGVMIQAFMVGVVFAKLSRPKKRAQTLLFSRQAVVSLRDGKPCLMFRVGDMRKSHIIESKVQAQLIRKKVTAEGELLPHHFHAVPVHFDNANDAILFIWPCTLVHVIGADSPFYGMSARDLLRDSFELVVILEGCIESTGMTTQARSSYLPSEILWGHRFEQLVSYRKDTGEYEVDYSRFNNTYEVDTPLCSARDLHDIQQSGECWRKHHAKGTSTAGRYGGQLALSALKRSRSCESLHGATTKSTDKPIATPAAVPAITAPPTIPLPPVVPPVVITPLPASVPANTAPATRRVRDANAAARRSEASARRKAAAAAAAAAATNAANKKTAAASAAVTNAENNKTTVSTTTSAPSVGDAV